MATRSTAPRMALALAGASALVAVALVGSSATGATLTKGRYSGTTSQDRVEKTARTIEFRVRGRKISLTQEPAVARNFCVSAPVFLLDEERITTKLNGRGAFGFSRTFVGSKINRIRGQFNDQGQIEGTVVYWFRDSDAGLCSAGKAEAKFTAKLRKGGKGD